MCDIMYLGDHCAPGIVICDILNKKDKLLFMLGSFTLNSIISYLSDNDWDLIYDKKYLVNKLQPGKTIYFKNELNKNIHFSHDNLNNTIFHSKYMFHFLHDYIVDENNNILNYDFIVEQYKNKIKNTKELFNNEKPVIFINFLWDKTMNDVIMKNIDQLINVLNGYIKHKKYYIIFFTNFELLNLHYENIFFIKLNNYYNDWHFKTNKNRFELYKEIYENFYNVTKKLNLNENFPIFENTYYYQNNKSNDNSLTCGIEL